MFQFTHPRGVRQPAPEEPAPEEEFQFTHPRGVRPSACGSRRHGRGFNSRTREGCDFFFRVESLMLCCFNSRTREGCDTATEQLAIDKAQFQFTHPRGVRPSDPPPPRSGRAFQFTHPRGVRRTPHSLSSPAPTFQFTHPRGVRLRHQGRLRPCRAVSIHAPARGATVIPNS